ncbi:hypothetical protein BC939DRAFT_61477 [Gamsiella multidivaricata]|uniref:uncharacterized protein n=1 Tax=Gamsiella multidivaricata TaxID=101098 RepID=UPI00221F233B|nr:uncharacterized protein BC939DRAFT_61477 [Gamsiella multidivaricata]KAI7828610.1 hypothetical protein BC939DRAFT_61477 [Gamsiella multidivaricata]
MPLYYKYVQLDLIKKDLRQQHQALLDATTPFDSSIIKRNRKPKTSVLASKRFSLALKVTTFILILVVALGYYYLWSKENRCLDPNLWIVKGWFIALLVVAVVVTALMFAAMYRAVKERRLLNTARYEADEDDVPNSQVINMDPREATPSQEPLSPTNPPPVYPGSPLSKDAPPGQMQTQTSSKPDQHELAQIEETIAEQLGQQQQQQQSHQQQMGQSQAGYGASGTGAYC